MQDEVIRSMMFKSIKSLHVCFCMHLQLNMDVCTAQDQTGLIFKLDWFEHKNSQAPPYSTYHKLVPNCSGQGIEVITF